ncbi:hypothetical protein ACFOWZ_41500 [Lentzea rhizosphaerae]|uniref:DUF4272 domain-containing protein n=1 Tax=Lentzea rhizosphaerae TaxID=2041025 RepID=A0ABV8C7D8_9PSEU
MVDDAMARRQFTVTAEIELDVVDAAALERAALAYIDEMVFAVDDDSEQAQEELRAAEREDVAGDPAAALSLLLDPDAIVEVDGVEVGGARYSVGEAGADDRSRAALPDFARLFEACECGLASCEKCGGFQVTPRTAAVLWTMGALLADQAFDDVIAHGDDPVGSAGLWMVFDAFPRITWRQDAIWRRQAARSFDDLRADLADGRWPQPSCAAEEMALHLMLTTAQAAVTDGWSGLEDRFSELPEHPDDLDGGMLVDVLFQDADILALFDPSRDGIEAPDDDENRYLGMGDYTPSAWFTPFDNMSPRDPRRPFRR